MPKRGKCGFKMDLEIASSAVLLGGTLHNVHKCPASGRSIPTTPGPAWLSTS